MRILSLNELEVVSGGIDSSRTDYSTGDILMISGIAIGMVWGAIAGTMEWGPLGVIPGTICGFYVGIIGGSFLVYPAIAIDDFSKKFLQPISQAITPKKCVKF